jgi:hypothetical protein
VPGGQCIGSAGLVCEARRATLFASGASGTQEQSWLRKYDGMKWAYLKALHCADCLQLKLQWWSTTLVVTDIWKRERSVSDDSTI